MIATLTFALAAALPAEGLLDSDHEFRRKGMQALADGSYSEAAEFLRKAVEANPADIDSWIELGRSYAGEADGKPVNTSEEWEQVASLYANAEESFRSAMEVDVGETHTGEIWGELGEVLLKQGKASETIATLYHAQTYRPENLRLLRNLGEALLMARSYAIEDEQWAEADSRLEEAAKVLEGAARIGQMQADVLRSLATVHEARGEPDEAMRSLRRAIALRPDDLDLHNAYIGSLKSSKKFDDGLSFYGGLLDAPALAQWYTAETQELKGHYNFQKTKDYAGAAEQYRDAERAFQASAASNPEYKTGATDRVPYARSYRGYALTKAGDLEGAESAFLAALDRKPGMEHALSGLDQLISALFLQMGGEEATREQFDEIRALAARCTMVNRDSANLWNNLGFFAREAGKYEESYQAYRWAVKLDDNNARFANDAALILVYHLKRDLDMAEEMLIDARDIAELALADAKSQQAHADHGETYGDSMVNLIVLYDQLDREEDGRAMLDRLMEEFPDRDEIPRWEKKLYPERVAEREAEEETAEEETGEEAGEGEAGDKTPPEDSDQ